jgi:hypothetical protein
MLGRLDFGLKGCEDVSLSDGVKMEQCHAIPAILSGK